MLGALSPLRLAPITQRWLSELSRLIRADPSSPARQQLYDLCHGLRFLRLAADTNAQAGRAALLSFLGSGAWDNPGPGC
jgi:hypothetical protein